MILPECIHVNHTRVQAGCCRRTIILHGRIPHSLLWGGVFVCQVVLAECSVLSEALTRIDRDANTIICYALTLHP